MVLSVKSSHVNKIIMHQAVCSYQRTEKSLCESLLYKPCQQSLGMFNISLQRILSKKQALSKNMSLTAVDCVSALREVMSRRETKTSQLSVTQHIFKASYSISVLSISFSASKM